MKVLSNRKVYSFYLLSKLLKTNYNTIKKNCYFLELLELVEIVKVGREESAMGIPSYRIKITEKGLDMVSITGLQYQQVHTTGNSTCWGCQ
ncbi:hypothetical protein [Archaeoglobus sp.]